ncbi:MAG: metallophosphoesterase [Actinomycetota bacterium]|nr:metallophosphoesterase [Actinomycetota bacterium]
MSRRTAIPLGLVGAGLAAVGYAVGYERTRWTLRVFELPALPPGSRALRVLHVSDVHMTPGQRGKQDWLRSLDRLDPHLVVVTGDNLAHEEAVPAVVDAYGPLLDRPGVVVFGSNDYFGPMPKNPLRYFNPNHKRVTGRPLPWRDLRSAFAARGWHDLSNRRQTLTVDGHRIDAGGVDDPHLRRDRYDSLGRPDPTADLRLGLAHSPEPRVLDRFAGDGYDLMLCGHTHGGQVRVPFYGALVTNCGIDRQRARWVSRYGDGMWLHVSAGLGTSPYAPYRFACPPEATLLTLVARTDDD